MPELKLTDKAVDRLPFTSSGYVEYYDTKLTGFGVRVGPKSKVYFVYGRVGKQQFKRNVFKGKTQLIDFDTAYNEAYRVLKDAAIGITPADRELQQKQEAEDKQIENSTLEEMLKSHCATRKKLKKDTKAHYEAKLKCYVPDWLKMPLLKITPSMAVQKHAEIGKVSKSQADHVFRVIRAVFNHAIEMHEDVFSANPVNRISRLGAWYNVPRKKKYIAPSKLPAYFDAVNRFPGLVSDYFTLLLFTGVRSQSEIAKIETGHIDFDEETITLFDTKTKDQLIVPVCKSAIAILKRRHDEAVAHKTKYLFFSFRSQAARASFGPCVFTSQEHLPKYVPSAKDQPLKNVRGSRDLIFKNTELADLTPHDMRRTFLTYCDELEIPNVVQKRLVGHSIPTDVTDGYKMLSLERLRRAVNRVEAFILEKANPVEEDTSPKN